MINRDKVNDIWQCEYGPYTISIWGEDKSASVHLNYHPPIHPEVFTQKALDNRIKVEDLTELWLSSDIDMQLEEFLQKVLDIF